jgi:hypothetical protein
MLLTQPQFDYSTGPVVFAPRPDQNRRNRIMAALGPCVGDSWRVGPESLGRYFAHLVAHLSLPFAACYPEPRTPQEKAEFGCRVTRLLDPGRHLGDPFDGIFCQTRKGRFQVNLPLVELCVSREDGNFQTIDDFCYWFWNWR